MNFSSLDVEDTPIVLITVGEDRRPVDEDAVVKLMESIRQIGLQTPITLREVPYDEDSAELHLVTGRHRLEAAKRLGWETIPAISHTDWDEIDAELWEISENLHRAELTALQRSEQVHRYAELVRTKAAQVAHPEPRYQKRGDSEAARQLGIDRDQIRRSSKIATLTPEAKAVAQETGLDDNQSVLLEASKRAPEDQATYLRERGKPQAPPPAPTNNYEAVNKQVAALMRAWNNAGPEARDRFLNAVDTPVFDRAAANA